MISRYKPKTKSEENKIIQSVESMISTQCVYKYFSILNLFIKLNCLNE